MKLDVDFIPYINNKDLYNSLSKNNSTKDKFLKKQKELFNNNQKYKTTCQDYNIFNFSELDHSKKSTYITYGINKKLIKEYNNNLNILRNKKELYQKFNKYLNRKWLIISKKNKKELTEFLDSNNTIIVNDKNNKKYINLTSENKTEIYNKLLKLNNSIIESSFLDENKNLQTIKAFVFNKKIISAVMVFNQELIAPINIETGIIDYPAINKKGNLYEKNPHTDEMILWYKIIKWPKTKRFIEKIAANLEVNLYLEIEVYTDEDNLILIDCNSPEYYLYQLPVHNTKKEGILLRIKENKRKEELY